MIKSEINYRIERPSNSGVQNLNRYAMDWWINSGSPYQHQAQNSKTWKKKRREIWHWCIYLLKQH
jgi:hypothetical protein